MMIPLVVEQAFEWFIGGPYQLKLRETPSNSSENGNKTR